MTTYFIDTGFLIALEAADDKHHAEAIAAWREIRKRRVAFVTTTYVFDEVVTFFNSPGHHAKALTIGETLQNSRIVTLVHVDEPIFAEAWREFAHQSDKRYSLTDCVCGDETPANQDRACLRQTFHPGGIRALAVTENHSRA